MKSSLTSINTSPSYKILKKLKYYFIATNISEIWIRRLTTLELKDVNSINRWIWANLKKRSLESDCLFTYLMIYIANLSSVVSWIHNVCITIDSSTCSNETSFLIFISAPFKISKSNLLFLGSLVFFEVTRKRQEWWDSVGFNFPFYPASWCLQVFGHHGKRLYFLSIERNFHLHETWTYSKVVIFRYKEMEKDWNHLGFLSAM